MPTILEAELFPVQRHYQDRGTAETDASLPFTCGCFHQSLTPQCLIWQTQLLQEEMGNESRGSGDLALGENTLDRSAKMKPRNTLSMRSFIAMTILKFTRPLPR